MKILYVAPEHVTGGFQLFAKGHLQRGNTARWVTFFDTPYDFPRDICFNLRAMPTRCWVRGIRRGLNRIQGRENLPLLEGNPPYWEPANRLEGALYALRDMLNASRIRRTIEKHSLDDYDIYHFEQGIDPFRNGRWVKSLASRGRGIVCFYHGTDIRNRGVIRTVHEVSHLNLTSEIDLLERLPGMKYLYLPIDTGELQPAPRPPDGRIRVCHAARNRFLKGSDHIEAVVRDLAGEFPVDWVMIENMPHREALRVKSHCDIFIDQITDLGGWGYGASSVEALSLGLPTLTRINPQVNDFLGEHPFVAVTPKTLRDRLVEVISDRELRLRLSREGRRWVEERHGLAAVMNRLYDYYREAGLL